MQQDLAEVLSDALALGGLAPDIEWPHIFDVMDDERKQVIDKRTASLGSGAMNLLWEYQCLFGYIHRWQCVVGDLRVIVEQKASILPVWRCFDKHSWETVKRSDDSYQDIEAAMNGAELFLQGHA